MSRYHLEIGGQPVQPSDGWTIKWLDRAAGIARLTDGTTTATVVVEGAGSRWHVVLHGRRVPVTVRTRREQLLADAEVAARHHGGPVEVRATLPGLVVAISATDGSEVAEGDPLLTIEAMKMQNEVRAPRDGVVAGLAVSAGQPVATGALLLRLE